MPAKNPDELAQEWRIEAHRVEREGLRANDGVLRRIGDMRGSTLRACADQLDALIRQLGSVRGRG